MEIERKFLIRSFPSLPVKAKSVIRQFFLSVEPYIRVRSKEINGTASYKLCIKGKGDLSREEIEFPMEKDVFERLTAIAGKPPVVKEQTVYALGEYSLECNLVDAGTENEFRYAEIEFSSEEEANAFDPPAFLEQEITYDPEYKMNRYWEKTRLNTL